MRKQTSIDPEMEYCRLVNVVWPEDIRPLLIKVLSAEKIDKLLCGFVMVCLDCVMAWSCVKPYLQSWTPCGSKFFKGRCERKY